MDDIEFARLADGREIAYRVVSRNDGPVMLHTSVATAPIELLDEDPMYDRFLRTLGQCGRLVLFDKPGIGASDPFDPDRDYLDQFADAHLAVMDAVEAPAAWVVGPAAPAAARLAADHRPRILGAALLHPIHPGTLDLVDVDAVLARDGGFGEPLQPGRSGDPAYTSWIRRAGRLGASAADARRWWVAVVEGLQRFFAQAEPITDAPPILLLRRRDADFGPGQEWWSTIFPEAECVTVEGVDVNVEALDAGLIAEIMAAFITGRRVDASTDRHLAAVLFTDLVDSTPTAARRGDAVWRATLDRYEAALRRTIERHHGALIKPTGDGALATFASGSQAVAAAIELRNVTRDLGLDGRTGIHVGEVERRGDDIGGIAVHLAARVMGQAAPGDIVATSTVTQTSVGGAFRFTDLGTRTLKGIDQPWQLLKVDLPDH